MTDEHIVRGVVKWFDLSKGFGFVIAEGVTQDILLHVNVVRQFGRNLVMAGDHISLTFAETDKGLQATALKDVQESEESVEQRNVQTPKASDELLPARLKWFDKGKGYGFLNVFTEPDDVFVHVDTLRSGGMFDAQVGEAMCAVIARGAKGAAATAVYQWEAACAWQVAQQKKGT